MPDLGFPPRSRSSACARTVFPAPVSPVMTFSPASRRSSARSIRSRFSTLSSVSMRGRVASGPDGKTERLFARRKRRDGARAPVPFAPMATRGQWLDSVPGPLALILTLAVAGVLLWWTFTRSGPRMREELRDDDLHPVTGRALAALPLPVLRGVTLLLAAGLLVYGISRVA